MTARTLDLFLRPDFDTIDIYDCGKLETEDYVKMFSVVPQVKSINLRHAGQLRDHVLDYIMERDVPLTHIQLEAPNLITSPKWTEFFESAGHRLQTLKLAWLDNTLLDENVAIIVQCCPNLTRLKFKKCTRLGEESLVALCKLRKLEYLSLQLSQPVTSSALVDLIASVGSKLKTLSLQNFNDADDTVLSTIHTSCRKLTKLRFTDNDVFTDAGFVELFSDWPNPPLSFIDFSSTRSLDYEKPDGPEAPVGLASAGFRALMQHSGEALERLDVSSCRHISREAFEEVFSAATSAPIPTAHGSKSKKTQNSRQQAPCSNSIRRKYPLLRDVNFSFLTKIDTPIVAGMFRCAPAIRKVTAFGCFNVTDVAVPVGVALIGLPNAQESIVQDGGGVMDLDF